MSEINNIKSTGQAELTANRNVNVRDDSSSQAVTGSTEQSSDTVSLTNTATQLQSLQQTLSDVPEVDSGRVEALKASSADGSYTVDANELAQNLIGFEQQLN